MIALKPIGADPYHRLGSVELGCFRLEEVIGQGSYGTTYLATQLGFDRQAVVKIAHAELLDTRDAETFAKGFVPNSINIGIDGSFAPWVGALILDIRQEILLIAEPGREEEVVTRLARVGYDYVIGYLDGGYQAWKEAGMEADAIQRVDAAEVGRLIQRGDQLHVLDVRKASEYFSEHVLDAENAPLDFINDSMAQVDKNKTYFVHCAGGYRSMIFASILRARGFDNLVDVRGGFKALKESGSVPVSDYVCPSTML